MRDCDGMMKSQKEDEEYKKYRELLSYEEVSVCGGVWTTRKSGFLVFVSIFKNYHTSDLRQQAPGYLQFNPFIRTGYRTALPSKLCWESMFWWTNETINIWSHVFGLFLFIALTIHDVAFLNVHAHFVDKVIVGILLLCFQLCMCLSSFYHIFCCRSENDYHCFLTYDLFGIALSLLAIYVSGIYYAFWCNSVSELNELWRVNKKLT